jgi:uncharacterized protein with GYD domain
MPTYILLSTLTPEGRHSLHKDPERIDAVNKDIEEFGSTLPNAPDHLVGDGDGDVVERHAK